MSVRMSIDGAIGYVNDHERLLLADTPYTEQEREQVVRLCDEERTAIRDYFSGRAVNLTQVRYRIAAERVQISRTARGRGADWQASMAPSQLSLLGQAVP